MDNRVSSFLNSLSSNSVVDDIRWDVSRDDVSFFSSCIAEFRQYGILSLLDIGTGLGNLVKMANNSGIDSYGVDPILFESNPRLFRGTMKTVIQNQHHLDGFKFSCISCVNFLHGLNHDDGEICDLFAFMKKHSSYLLITKPRVSDNVLNNCMKDLTLMKEFDRSHGGAYHFLYRISP